MIGILIKVFPSSILKIATSPSLIKNAMVTSRPWHLFHLPSTFLLLFLWQMYTCNKRSWSLSVSGRLLHRKIGQRRMGARFPWRESQHDKREHTFEVGHWSDDLRGAHHAHHHSNLARWHGRCTSQRTSVRFTSSQKFNVQLRTTHRPDRLG